MTDPEIYQKRDLLLTEIHTDLKYIRQRIDDQKIALKEHEQKDEKIQGWILKIGIGVLVIVLANGGMEALKVLFKIGG